MFGDLLLPPTFVADWHMLGFPAGLIVFLAVAASLFTTGIVLARRRVPVYWIIPLCLILFVAADLVTYVVGNKLPRPPRPQPQFLKDRIEEYERKNETPVNPKD